MKHFELMRLVLFISLLPVKAISAMLPHQRLGCDSKCIQSGNGCEGIVSSCSNPSCAMGCMASTYAKSEAVCNATCDAAVKASCNYQVLGCMNDTASKSVTLSH